MTDGLGLGARPQMTYQGHIFGVKGDPLEAPVAECLECGLQVDPAEPTIPYPCPRTEEGRRLQAEADRHRGATPEVTTPTILVPPDFTGTEAEAIGLALAGVVQAITNERDDLKRLSDEANAQRTDLLHALKDLVDQTPEGTFAASNAALDRAKAVLERLAPKPTT
jgi:hypothetical protein